MMKRILFVLFVVVVIFVGLGLYRGWFTLSSPGDNRGDKASINLEVDGGKMKEDAASLKRKTKELTEGLTGGKKAPCDN
jgi:hypothetical protein